MATTPLHATLLTAFVVTFATAVIPNPSTVAASRFGLVRGWQAAAAFLSAVLLLDIVVFWVLVVGLQPTLLLAGGGGSALVPVAATVMTIVGIAIMVSPPDLAPQERGAEAVIPVRNLLEGPFIAGILVPTANPGFWAWWVTVGASFIHTARQWGKTGIAGLLAVMLAGVLAWYLPLVLALRQGRTVFSPVALRRVLRLLGAALAVFGTYLFLSALELI